MKLQLDVPVLITVLLLTACPVASADEGPSDIPAMGHRPSAFVAATPGYRFHSDFWLNLHLYLYGIAGGGTDPRAGYEPEALECFEQLDAEKAEPWRRARDYYRQHLGTLNHQGGLMRQLRFDLVNLNPRAHFDPHVESILELLRGAAFAYRTCLWDDHDAMNRKRIGDVTSILVQHAGPVQEYLSFLYRRGWPPSVVVDVAVYTDFAGVSTDGALGLPDHITIASGRDATADWSGLEMLHHESSHVLFGARKGRVTEALRRAAESQGVQLPRHLWHAVSFYTSGEIVRRRAEKAGIDYQPYMFRNGTFSEFHEALREHWTPFIDRTVDLDAAAGHLVQAVVAEYESSR